MIIVHKRRKVKRRAGLSIVYCVAMYAFDGVSSVRFTES
jgi:hypothetical protein